MTTKNGTAKATARRSAKVKAETPRRRAAAGGSPAPADDVNEYTAARNAMQLRIKAAIAELRKRLAWPSPPSTGRCTADGGRLSGGS
jgi:hypothetical protein